MRTIALIPVRYSPADGPSGPVSRRRVEAVQDQGGSHKPSNIPENGNPQAPPNPAINEETTPRARLPERGLSSASARSPVAATGSVGRGLGPEPANCPALAPFAASVARLVRNHIRGRASGISEKILA
jgi:hypothetical protein